MPPARFLDQPSCPQTLSLLLFICGLNPPLHQGALSVSCVPDLMGPDSSGMSRWDLYCTLQLGDELCYLITSIIECLRGGQTSLVS